MSSRVTYGKRGKRLSNRLQPSVEFSPQKQNNLADRTLTTSSDTLDSDGAPLTSPFNSPTKAVQGKEVTPDADDNDASFDYGVFDLEDEPNKSNMVKKIKRTRTKKISKPKVKEQTTISESPKGSLNSFFVEAQSKPSWSPSKSASPERRVEVINTQQKTPSSSFSKTLGKLQLESAKIRKSPKRPVTVQQEQGSVDAWDFLSDISEDHPKKKTMIFKENDENLHDNQSESESNHITEQNHLISFFGGKEQESIEDEEPPSTPVPTREPSVNPELAASPRVSKLSRSYGAQRSFLIDRENHEREVQHDGEDEHDITLTSEHDQDTGDRLKNISNLRAQGENAQFLDELNFIVEGIESTSSTSSLLELALKLFDEEFAIPLKNHGLPPLQNYIKRENNLQIFLFGFIACKVSEGGNGRLDFDDNMEELVVSLLNASDTVDAKQESRATKSMFSELKENFDQDYKPSFFGLTLLIQNGLYMNQKIFEATFKLFKKLVSDQPFDIKMINMVLLLFESFLSSTEEIHTYFKEIVSLLIDIDIKDETCYLAILKVLIVLSVKKFPPVFNVKLLNRSIDNSIKNANTSVGLLELGLLINLVENEECCEVAFQPGKLKRLHYKLENDSKDYYSLLIGIMSTKDPEKIKSIFNSLDLKDIASHLKNFDSKGNKLISLQVEEYLSKMHKLNVF